MRLSRAELYAKAKKVDLARKALEEADRQFSDIVMDGNGKYADNIGFRVDHLLRIIEGQVKT